MDTGFDTCSPWWCMMTAQLGRGFTPQALGIAQKLRSLTTALADAAPLVDPHPAAMRSPIPQHNFGRAAFHAGSPAQCSADLQSKSFLASIFANNQFASGGLALMAVGAAAAALKTSLDYLIEYGKRRLFVQAEIDSRDDAYRWLMHWLGQHPQFRESPRVSLITSLMVFGTSGLEGSLVGAKKVMYLPAPGDHLLRYRHKWLWISRRRSSAAAQAAANTRVLLEMLTVTAWGRSREVLEQLVADAAAAYDQTTRQRTVVHSVDQDGYWTRVGSRPIRPLSTVILPGNMADELLSDCREFLSSEAWYAHHGIPYRRGYLLYGLPGTGKTSLVTALAGELGLDIYVVTLSSPLMTDEMLRNLLNSAADRSILLLEDVDAAFVGREGGGGKANHLSFSGLLNAIDGVAAQEGRLLFLTTNHIERLSSALIRPGRVDFRVEFKLATKEQTRQLFISFYHDLPQDATTKAQGGGTVSTSGSEDISTGGTKVNKVSNSSDAHDGQQAAAAVAAATKQTPQATSLPAVFKPATSSLVLGPGELEDLAARFSAAIPAGAVSIAQLQGYLMAYKKDPLGAVSHVQEWLAQQQQQQQQQQQ